MHEIYMMFATASKLDAVPTSKVDRGVCTPPTHCLEPRSRAGLRGQYIMCPAVEGGQAARSIHQHRECHIHQTIITLR